VCGAILNREEDGNVPVVTLAERKRRSAEKMTAAAEAVMAELSDYARAHGGQFIVFGSAASRTMRHDSDLDVIVDFPLDREADAWREVEDACVRHGIKPDVLPASMTKKSFVSRIMKSPTRVLP
jgi:predicted nucleotidyltransferase